MKKYLFSLLLALLSLNGKSQDRYSDSLKTILPISSDSAKLKSLYEIGSINMFSYPDTCVKYGRLALEMAQKLGDKRKEAASAGLLCVGFTNTGNYSAALDFGYKSLGYYKLKNDSSAVIIAYLQLMNCYKDQEDYNEALMQGHKAMKLFSPATVDSSFKGLIYSIMSMSYERNNQLDSALYFGTLSRNHYPQWAGTYLTLGNVYAKKNMYDTASKYYYDVIRLNNDVFTNNIYAVDAYNSLSNLFKSEQKIDSAIYYSYKVINQVGTESYKEGILKASLQLGNLFILKNMPDSSIKYLLMALRLKDSLFNKNKLRESQNFAFNEKIKDQQYVFEKEKDASKRRMYFLGSLIVAALIAVILLLRNIQARKKARTKIEKAYQELKLTQSQLIQSEKMASLGELTAGIAHEIQNPLNFVNNFSEVNKELIVEMVEEVEKGNFSEVKEIANDIKENEEKINHHGKRADAIVKGMLQHSRASSGQKEPTDINALCDEYLRLSYHGLRAKDKSFNATLKTDFDESIGKVNVISQDLGRVIMNLLTNAFYAVNEKKKSYEGSAMSYEPAVSVSTRKINNKVEIMVSDNGNGIPDSVKNKIFQPFFTTKPTGQGTGLGLSLSYDIIKAHHGEIEVSSEAGVYTEFKIILRQQ